jgi:hypothetical protein
VNRHIKTSTLELSIPLPYIQFCPSSPDLFFLASKSSDFCVHRFCPQESETKQGLLLEPDERERRERERDPAHIHTPAARASILVSPVNGLTAADERSSEPSAVNAMIFKFQNSIIPEYSGEPALSWKVKSLLTVCRLMTIGDEITPGHGAGMHSKG